MRYKRCGSKLVVRIDKGEEIIHTLLKVCGCLRYYSGIDKRHRGNQPRDHRVV